jgi:hypothetical protein
MTKIFKLVDKEQIIDGTTTDVPEKEHAQRYTVARFFDIQREILSQLGFLCRVFASDDPKAELTKITNELSVFFLCPEPNTLTDAELVAWLSQRHLEFRELTNQNWTSVQAFLSNDSTADSL